MGTTGGASRSLRQRPQRWARKQPAGAARLESRRGESSRSYVIVWEIGKSLIEIKSPARNYRLVRRCAGIAAATYLASPRMLALTNLASSGLIQINLALSALAMLAPRLDPNAAYGQYVRRTPRISAAGDGGRAGAWYRAISGKDLAAMNTAKKSSGTDGTGHELGDETFISA